MKALHAVAAGLLPPLCAACGRSCRLQATLCNRCTRRLAEAAPLAGGAPPGLDRAWSSASHEGVARELVTSLKFRRLLPVAELMAERIQWLAPATLLGGAIVPVPTASLRTLRRGFVPAGAIGTPLAGPRGASPTPCLAPRGAGRQPPRPAHRPPAGDRRQGGGPPQRPPHRRRAHHRRHPLCLRQGIACAWGGPHRRPHLLAAGVMALSRGGGGGYG